MTIKQKIWSIPRFTILLFFAWIVLAYNSSTQIYTSLQRISDIHYPYMRHIQTLSESLIGIQDIFLDAIDAESKLTLARANHKAEDFRTIVNEIAVIDEKKEIAQEMLAQFNDYFSAAELSVSLLMGIEKGDSASSIKQMTVALKKLKGTVSRERSESDQNLHNRLHDIRTDLQAILISGLISIIILLIVMVYTARLLITSIMTNLDNLRAAAIKIAQGDFNARIPERGQDELTQIIKSFNSMGRDLQVAAEKRIQHEINLESLNQELETRVTDRTEKLAAALDAAHKANAAVAYMADHDTLTGLLSRRRFQEEYERWGKYALRYERPMALMFIDLDKFKHINDTYGHPGGDEYLQAVSEVLKKTLRLTDYLARWGGDEFSVLLPETTSDSACLVATKLIHKLSITPVTVAGNSLYASVSIGIAALPEHTSDTFMLTSFADAAMYQAKSVGLGGFNLYSESNQETQHLGEHVRWAGRIRRALETDQFILYYQPLLDLNSGESSEYEALLRMENQNGEHISPGLFLESAERFDLSILIDRMVFRKAVQKIASFKANKVMLHLSLNLSAQFLNDPGIIDYIREIIAEFDIDSVSLSIEISESEILQNINRVRIFSSEISQLGCRLILDDIGVGFSSFHYLAPLSIHAIKIRGDLINNLHIEKNRDYLAMLCKTCHQQKIKVVAKYVEDLSLLDMLRSIGIDYAQGFAVGKPMESLSMINMA
ncbi:MAG: EAL domain-containing protein [Gallionella sp.]